MMQLVKGFFMLFLTCPSWQLSLSPLPDFQMYICCITETCLSWKFHRNCNARRNKCKPLKVAICRFSQLPHSEWSSQAQVGIYSLWLKQIKWKWIRIMEKIGQCFSKEHNSELIIFCKWMKIPKCIFPFHPYTSGCHNRNVAQHSASKGILSINWRVAIGKQLL